MESSEYRRNQSENNFTTLQKIWYSSDKENKKRRQVEEKILDYRIPEAHDLSKPTSTPRMEPIKSRRRTKQENFLWYRSTAKNNNCLTFHKIWYPSEERDKEEKHRQVKEEWLDCQMPEAIEVNPSKRRCLWPSAKESYMPYTSGIQNTQVKWYSSEERDKEEKHRQVKEEWLDCQMPEAIEVNPSKRRCLWPSAKESYMPYTSGVQNTQVKWYSSEEMDKEEKHRQVKEEWLDCQMPDAIEVNPSKRRCLWRSSKETYMPYTSGVQNTQVKWYSSEEMDKEEKHRQVKEEWLDCQMPEAIEVNPSRRRCLWRSSKETYMPYTSRVQNTQSSITKADPFSLHYGDIPQPCKENVSIPQEYSTVIKYRASLLSNSSESYRPSHRYSIYDENGYNVRGYYTAGFYPQQ
ncbi:uncharacterized protein [Procambarus clarkii]|uniref:uncharacterized protein n=1 Tax=Procambarus clarkii TaxID=6728 RepID=UPI003744B1E2